MGSSFAERDRNDNEGPQHDVEIATTFAIGKYKVTFAQWDLCVAAGGGSYKAQDRGWGCGNRPVMYVSWNDTQEYLTWMSSVTDQQFRLQSEAEWEFATRAGGQAKCWWVMKSVKVARFVQIVVITVRDAPYRSVHCHQIHLACMMCMATFGNGFKTVGMLLMKVRRQTAQRGSIPIAPNTL